MLCSEQHKNKNGLQNVETKEKAKHFQHKVNKALLRLS